VVEHGRHVFASTVIGGKRDAKASIREVIHDGGARRDGRGIGLLATPANRRPMANEREDSANEAS
jgi:hypothetical protein